MLFEGDITDYWSPAVVRHWVLHLAVLNGTPIGPTARKLYLLLRAMLTSSPRGLRRMTHDQLGYLLSEYGEKPVAESTVRAAVAQLRDSGLVSNPDGERLVTSTGRGTIQTVARRFKVNDLPPDDFVGWSNTWQKLDAYRPDWRTNPVEPPRHIRTPEGIVRSFSSGRSDQQEQAAPDAPQDETPGQIDRSISSSACWISSNGRSISAAAGGLTSDNGPLIKGDTPFSLSAGTSDEQVDDLPAEDGQAERENAAQDPDPTPAAPGAVVPAQQDPHRRDALKVLAAYEDALGAPALNRTRFLAQAAELLAARPLPWVIDRARELPRWGNDLKRHAEMSKAPITRRPAAPSGTAVAMCPAHPAVEAVHCAPCAEEELDRVARRAARTAASRPISEAAPVGGSIAAILARKTAGRIPAGS
jgi:hypothetical protein